jgi:hypothetical protein
LNTSVRLLRRISTSLVLAAALIVTAALLVLGAGARPAHAASAGPARPTAAVPDTCSHHATISQNAKTEILTGEDHYKGCGSGSGCAGVMTLYILYKGTWEVIAGPQDSLGSCGSGTLIISKGGCKYTKKTAYSYEATGGLLRWSDRSPELTIHRLC